MVLQALEKGVFLERQELHAQELHIANWKAMYINSKKERPPYVRDDDFYFFTPEETGPIDADTCAVIKKVLPELPPWTFGSLEMKLVLRDAPKGKLIKPYLFKAKGICIINPKIDKVNKWIEIGAVVVKDPTLRGKWVTVTDAETKKQYDVEVPRDFKGYEYRTGWRIDLMDDLSSTILEDTPVFQ